jgi:hypothetical protein
VRLHGSDMLRFILAILGMAILSWFGVGGPHKALADEQTLEIQQRQLLVGHDVIRNETLSTQGTGQVQLLFTDQSTMTVAKNSEVIIDQFVFDAQKQSGTFSATLTTGLFQYVGGKISRQQDVTFKTPTGSVSVRGGIVLIKISGDSITAILVHGDHMTVTVHGTSQSTSQPNTAIISTGGGGPSEPSPATIELIKELTTQLEALNVTIYGHSVRA